MATLVASVLVAALAPQASVAPSATLLAELVLASLVRLLVDSVVPSVPPLMVASVDNLAVKANSPLVAAVVLPSLLVKANSPLVAVVDPSVKANSKLVAKMLVALAADSVKANSTLVADVVLPSLLAPTLVAVVEDSLLAKPNSPSVAEAALSVVLSVPRVLALKLSAPRAVELNSDFSVAALRSPEVSRVNSTPSAVNPLEDVQLLKLELTPLRAVLPELDKLLLKVKRVALVLEVSMALPTIPLTPLLEDLVLPALEPRPSKLLLSVQEDLLPKDNVVASRLVSQA